MTVLRGHKRRHGSLELEFSGPTAGSGELTLKSCRIYFEVRRR